jgi:hypothetical protein
LYLFFVVAFAACKHYLDFFAIFNFFKREARATFWAKLHIQNVLFTADTLLKMERGDIRFSKLALIFPHIYCDATNHDFHILRVRLSLKGSQRGAKNAGI